MAALSEQHVYGLASGSDSAKLFHVKLTGTALRVLEAHQGGKHSSVSQPTIRFNGTKGYIKIPELATDGRSGFHTFSFDVSSVGRDGPQGSLDCVRQYSGSEGKGQLDCLGSILEKVTVHATDDSYQTTRERMTKAEEETRSRGAIVIKQGGPYVGKRTVCRRKLPTSSLELDPRRKRTAPVNPASMIKRTRPAGGGGTTNVNPGATVASSRLYREHVIHALALQPYKVPELLVRLEKDGVGPPDRRQLTATLEQVGVQNQRDGPYSLKPSMYQELQHDWSGYTNAERQKLQQQLARKAGRGPQDKEVSQKSSAMPARESSHKTTTCKSSGPPAQEASPSQQKRTAPTETADPLSAKRSRVSHLTSRVSPSQNGFRSSCSPDKAAAPQTQIQSSKPSTAQPESQPTQTLEAHGATAPIHSSGESLPVDKERTEEKVQDAVGTTGGKCSPNRTENSPSFALAVATKDQPAQLDGAHLQSHKKNKKHKEKERERRKEGDERNRRGLLENIENLREPNRLRPEPSKDNMDSKSSCNVQLSSSDMPDYISSFQPIKNLEQRQAYKNAFNSEYGEYRRLHADIEHVTQNFVQLDNELRNLPPGSDEYKVVHDQVLQEYKKIKKTNPNYYEDKRRCQYLHQKLAHIKRLIVEYDQGAVNVW
uniref:RNA polymerase II elongation factor ELL-like isoform X1 n=1 Tax=Myxine glutinosa TaxID=7769 RepID=UPI00358F3555